MRRYLNEHWSSIKRIFSLAMFCINVLTIVIKINMPIFNL